MSEDDLNNIKLAAQSCRLDFKKNYGLCDSNNNLYESICKLLNCKGINLLSLEDIKEPYYLLEVNNSSEFTINLRKSISEREKNFELACVLANLKLHLNNGIEQKFLHFVLSNDTLLKKQEEEADLFAYEFLLPEENFKAMYKSIKSTNFLAINYNVEVCIIENRKKMLDLK